MEDFTVRKAEGEEIFDISEFFCNVFWEEQRIPKEMARLAKIFNPIYWGAFYRGELMGTAVTWEEEGKTHFGRFTVKKNFRRQGLGKKITEEVFLNTFENTEIILSEARAYTTEMLVKMGGEITGETLEFFVGTITPLKLERHRFYKYIKSKNTKKV